jgi:hypothetical protein
MHVFDGRKKDSNGSSRAKAGAHAVENAYLQVEMIRVALKGYVRAKEGCIKLK